MLTTSPCTRVLCTRGRIVLSIALTMCLGLASQAQNNAVNFTTSQPVVLTGPLYPNLEPVVGGNPCGPLFAGKFHKSAQLDFVSSCRQNIPPGNGPFTTVLLNKGNGFFLPIADSAIDYNEVPIKPVDLNGDGLSDLVIHSPYFPGALFGVQISSSAANGTFEAPVFYTISGVPAGSGVTGVVTGDFEHNGRMDVAVLTSGPNNLTIFLNDGTGKFTQAATYALNPTPAGFNPPILVAGDINNDGKVDITVVYTGTTGTAVPYISQGNGKFIKGSTRSAGNSPIAAAWGDFNKDGFGDIAVTTPTGVNVIFGSSSGNFTGNKFTYYPAPIATLNAGEFVVAGDFDRDGNLDLAVSANNGVDIFWGAGNGAFPAFSAYTGTAYGGLVAADINADGRLDLADSPNDTSFNILYNLGGRTFRGAPSTHSPNANGIVAGDFNRDGNQDVAVVNTPSCAAPCNGTVTILPGSGLTYFNSGPSYTIGMHGSAIAAGDLNGDGILDLVVTNATPGDNADVSILLGTKTGTFGPARNLTLGSLSNDAILADVNGDGKLDLIEDGGVALGDGKGSFGNLTPFPDGVTYTSLTQLAVADFNGDGHPDIAATWAPPDNSQMADFLINNGKGDFSGAPFIIVDDPAFSFVTGVAAGPLTGTANDVVFAGTAYSQEQDETGFQVFVNDGKGNFTLGPAYGAGPGYSQGVVIADFNKDGHNDIGFSNGDSFLVSPGPSFNTVSTQFNATIINSYSAIADFNKDGWPDIVFTGPYGVSRLYNVPVPTVTPGLLNFSGSGSGSQKVTIKNTLKTSQAITAGFGNETSSDSGFTFGSDTCHTLAAGASCTITVNFNPSNSGGGATLYISSNGQFIAAVALVP